MTLTKRNLVVKISTETGIIQHEVMQVVQKTLDYIAEAVSRGDKVELRNVTTARAVGDQWLVTSGLTAGDRVIVEGLQKIGPGMPVQSAEYVAPAASSAPPPPAPPAAGSK